MNQFMLQNLKDQHQYLDNMITELDNRKFPNEYVSPYKKRKLTIKDDITQVEKEMERMNGIEPSS